MIDKNLIDLNYYDLQTLKSAIHQMHKGVISDLDKESRLRICKRTFEFTGEQSGKTFQVTLEIKELEE